MQSAVEFVFLLLECFMAWDGADSGYGSLQGGTIISSFYQIINKFFAVLIQKVVGVAYTAYSKEAEWDSFLGVVRVTDMPEAPFPPF